MLASSVFTFHTIRFERKAQSELIQRVPILSGRSQSVVPAATTGTQSRRGQTAALPVGNRSGAAMTRPRRSACCFTIIGAHGTTISSSLRCDQRPVSLRFTGGWLSPVPLLDRTSSTSQTVRSSHAGIRSGPQVRHASVCGSAPRVALPATLRSTFLARRPADRSRASAIRGMRKPVTTGGRTSDGSSSSQCAISHSAEESDRARASGSMVPRRRSRQKALWSAN